jgi:hypothetical protein
LHNARALQVSEATTALQLAVKDTKEAMQLSLVPRTEFGNQRKNFDAHPFHAEASFLILTPMGMRIALAQLCTMVITALRAAE